MAVHQAAKRHVPGVDTHSMGTFTGIARSLMEMGKKNKTKKNREDEKLHEASTDTLLSADLHEHR